MNLTEMGCGVFVGKVEHPDGEWLIGDVLPVGHPGRIEKDDPRQLMFKVWQAGNSENYQRTATRKGWEPPLPAYNGRLEGMQVFTGKFACETKRGVAILNPGDSVELRADEYRCWFLPEGSTGAQGITICCHDRDILGVLGGGQKYLYADFIFTDGSKLLKRLSSYHPPYPGMKHQLFVVFEGGLFDQANQLRLEPMSYVFYPNVKTWLWETATPYVSFALVYF